MNTRKKSPVVRLAIACLLVFIGFNQLSTKVMSLCVVDGESMSPTFQDGQYTLMKPAVSFSEKDVSFYDVVVFYQTLEREDGSEYRDTLIKRVIGLPGDTVEITEDGAVLVNGLVINDRCALEPVQKDNRGIASQSITVPEGCLFVLGDNRNASVDSRVFGVIRYPQICGKIVELSW